MNKTLTFLFSLIILSSCQEKKNFENKDELCKIIVGIIESDQKYRGLPEMEDPFFSVLDSLRKVNNIEVKDYANLSREQQLEWGKKAREISDKISQTSKHKQDSLMRLQIEIDNHNTELLIDIVKEKGWITENTLECKENVSTWIIFRHSQTKYWTEIREIIEKEKAKKRINDFEYEMIDNHIKGRPTIKRK
ncbi:hypothetical protein [Tenacibaculum dicentrarchi]|uniref:Lipoprotein n=1 Tax=Tenacibaculum dicentrarchi TaxID=669041 RepID=A0ABM9NXL4_9FLAO